MTTINPIFDLAAKLRTAIRNLGTKEDTQFACPPSQDKLDPVLHELFVARTGEKMMKDRADKALKALKLYAEEYKGDTIEKMRKTTTEERIPSNATLLEASHYTFSVKFATPARKLDKALLTVNLAKRGMTSIEIAKLLEDSTSENKPAESYTVAPSGEAFEED